LDGIGAGAGGLSRFGSACSATIAATAIAAGLPAAAQRIRIRPIHG
jgi:hypothetical protein